MSDIPAILDELERMEKDATAAPWSVMGEGGVSMKDGERDSYRIEGPHDGTHWPKIARVGGPERTGGPNFRLVAEIRNRAPLLLALARLAVEAAPWVLQRAEETSPVQFENYEADWCRRFDALAAQEEKT